MNKSLNIMVTGAGSVMGQSIVKAIDEIKSDYNIYLTNSDSLGAAFYFDSMRNSSIVKNLIVPLANDKNYLNIIDNYVKEYKIDVIFPGTQHELRKLSSYHDIYENVGVLKPLIVEYFIDKEKTAVLFDKHDIRFPKSKTLDIYDKDGYKNEQIIIKPKTNSASRNISLINSQIKYDEIVNDIKNSDNSLNEYVVQEYLDGLEYTCGCYIDRYTKKVNTITFERELTLDGATGYGTIISNPKIDAYAKKIAKAIVSEGMEFGHFNIQFRLVNGEPICFEVNGRLSSTEAPKAKFGFNSVEAYITNIALKKSYEKFNPKTTGQFLRYYDEVYF